MSTSLTAARKASYSDSFEERVNGAVALKDYATSRALNVPDSILKTINSAHSMSNSSDIPLEISVRLDEAIRDLSKITYPTTIETLVFSSGRTLRARLISKYSLPVLALLAVIITIWSFGQPQPTRYSLSILASALGLLGALVFHLFNLIGVIEEKALNAEDAYANFIRIILGPVVGWVFYFGFSQNAFAQSNSPNFDTSQRATLLLLLVPFLAGFSTRLVVGVINQVIRAVELTLGIEDKRNDILIRRRKNKDKLNGS